MFDGEFNLLNKLIVKISVFRIFKIKNEVMEGLFKENKEVNNSNYYKMAKEFVKNKNCLSACLGIIPKELKRNDSVIKGWEHNECLFESNSSDRVTEKRICKCFYYRNKMCKKNKCNISFFEKKYMLNNCNVLDYEIPVSYVTSKIGEFDLLIKYKDDNYAVEVKPPNSKETILRMILEILTYDFCNCYNGDNKSVYNHDERAIIKNNNPNEKSKLKDGYTIN